MSAETFPFQVGAFDCIVVKDGSYAYPYPAQNIFINFFVNATIEHLEQVLRKHDLDPEQWEEYVSPYVSLVINTRQNLVLVDTGAGGIAPTTGKLIQTLQSRGITPEDFDTVILTHGHPDHIGGNIDKAGNPAFPNARYILWKDEWEFWTSEPNLDELKISDHGKELLVEVAQDNLLPLRDQIELISQDTEIVTGIRVILAPGHTPGHMVVEVLSGSDQLLYISDTVLHPIHLQKPDWYSAVAINPRQVVETRSQILDMASKEKMLTLASHFTFPSLGYVLQKEEGWDWQPIGLPRYTLD
jgi:glyoxylase-like metal-dependent hydrolase (beta-lactamase superfamily II)